MADRIPDPPLPSPAAEARLGQLAAMLKHLRATVRYVDYRQAEHDCEALAAQILDRYDARDLGRFSFVAIPRGGWIVLGMLAYYLDLPPGRLPGDPATAEAVVLVDDCALTGLRLARALGGLRASEVVVAHLYSHPELRRAVLEREPRVRHCLAAHDLADHARTSFGDGEAYAAWHERWEARLGAERYWQGLPELVCFAWGEPDRPLFNAATGKVEDGWRFLPPHLCLKNRARLAPPALHSRQGELRVRPSVASGEFDGLLWLCETESGRVMSLEGSGLEMWRRVAAGRDLASTVEELAVLYSVEAARVGKDLRRFVDNLVAAGVLERIPAPPAGESRE